MQNEQNSDLKNSRKEGKTETITELAHRHLSDQSHTTSDEELRNAKVEFSENPKIPDDNLFELDNTSLAKNDSDVTENIGDAEEKHDNNPPNPYTVLGP